MSAEKYQDSIKPGSRFGPYEIIGPLGAGGMGRVFQARDVRLHRDVAIKILSLDSVGNAELQRRFAQEALIASALNHPNILIVHDIGNLNGTEYIVTELIEGESLRKVVKRGPLPLKRLLDIGIQIADGLASAHQAGVVHRDLKPDNIMISKEGRAKILDFGLAKALTEHIAGPNEDTIPPSITKNGIIIGTVPYMSPEQAQNLEIDFRSDQFSFGLILYEMITGKTAFHRDNAMRTLAAIISENHIPITTHNPKAPQSLIWLIDRCLQKDPKDRYGATIDLYHELVSVREHLSDATITQPQELRKSKTKFSMWIISIFLIAAILIGVSSGKLRRIFGHSTSRKIESLAILPLKNLSGDPKQEYFADGMTEELIATFAGIDSLRVVSRSSVMEYKKENKSVPVIAKELNVDAIVEGSVMQAGDQVRITAQLIDAATDRHIWGRSYERDLRNILALQNEVAQSIVDEIQIKLDPKDEKRLAHAPPVNPQAYLAYLRAWQIRNPDLTKDDARLIIDLLDRAVELDPKFALAYTQLCRIHSLWIFIDWEDKKTHAEKAKRAVDRAFELQPGMPEAHVALGFYFFQVLKDKDKALKEFAIAAKDLPNDSELLRGIGFIQRQKGNYQAATETLEKIYALNPKDAIVLIQIGLTYQQMRIYSKADHYFDLAIALQPDALDPYLYKAQTQIMWKGEIAKSRAILEKIPKHHLGKSSWGESWYVQEMYERDYPAALKCILSTPENPWKDIWAGVAYRQMNENSKAIASFEAAKASLEKSIKDEPDNARSHTALSLAYAGLGKKNEAVMEGNIGVKLNPITEDAFGGPGHVLYLATVYAMVGEKDAALDQIETLLKAPTGYWLSIPDLKLDPKWDSLRDHPRYKELLKTFQNE